MKACPHCGGQIRPSVIRCTQCGMSLTGDREGSGGGAVAVSEVAGSGGRRPVAAPARIPTAAQAPTAAAKPAHGSTELPIDVWAVSAPRVRPHRPPPTGSRTGGASIRRTDLPLMAAGVLAAAAGALAYSALAVPWVHARISDATGSHLAAEITLRGSDSIAGRAGVGIAIALGLLGLVWFWYGLDRGVGVPAIAHPASALIVALIAGIVVIFAAIGYLFWNDALVASAREAGMTKRAMRDLLDARPAPTIAIERLAGVLRFAAAAGLALLAGAVAWRAERRRN
jgi:hypothetical protein